MERLRRVFVTIAAGLSRLNGTQRLLVAAVAVVMAMTLLLVQVYSGRSDLVPLMPAGGAGQASAVQFLQTSGVSFTERNGQIMVPSSQRQWLIAQMTQAGAMPSDSRILFDNLIDKQSWTYSQQQNQQLVTIAVQNELSSIISKMSGVESASVILNLPDKRSLGQPNAPPSASATIFPSRALDQNTVDSIAHLVAGSRGIDPSHVRVIDGKSNRQYKAREEGSMTASTYLEFVGAVESRKREAILEMLSAYIPGVIVTVHAQVDVTQRRTETDSVLPEGKGSASLLKSEQTTTREERRGESGGGLASGGEPGPRSNTQEDISGLASDVGGRSTESTGDSMFETEFGREKRVVVDPRGNPTKINAVVNIPRSYFVGVWRSQQPRPAEGAGDAAAAEPAEADLTPIVQSETARIKGEVELQIDTSAGTDTVKGEVQVSMIPVSVPGPGESGTGQASFLGMPSGSIAMDGLVKNVALGGLAVVALGMIAVTAMRASKREALPTASEMVGLPPALEGGVDIVGEAGEADSALTGIELTDDQMRTRKIGEQVADIVTEKPEDTARLLGRWISNA